MLRAVEHPRLLVSLALGFAGLALWHRVSQAKTFLYADLQHFFQFADTLFTARHLDYYQSVADQTFTYAHLPLFPMLLAPFQRLYLAAGSEPIFAVKTLVYAFDFATAGLLVLLALRRGLTRAQSLGVGVLWLFAPWLLEAGALNGHVTSIAAFFFVAALLRLRVPWQAGVLVSLSVVTRSEFALAAAALGGYYLRRGPRPALGFGAGALAVLAVIVGPFLLRDAGAVHWAVVGHLQGRGDALPVLRGLFKTFTGDLPDVFKGPQDWAMPLALLLAPAVGFFNRGAARGVFQASLIYALALALGHGRYFVLPLVTGFAYAVRPQRYPWILIVFAAEFLLPLTRDLRWVLRFAAIALFFLWPLLARSVRARAGVRANAKSKIEAPA